VNRSPVGPETRAGNEFASNASTMATAPSATAATVDAVFELSQLLNCGLDRKQVQICMALIDAGVNPHGLAAAIKELREVTSSSSTAPGAVAPGSGGGAARR